jgi:hypothetical protein
MTKNALILAAAALFASGIASLRPKRHRSMTALVRRCRPVQQSPPAQIRRTRRMTHQPEPAVRLPAMRGFRPIVTPTLRPYPSALPLPLQTRRADNRPGVPEHRFSVVEFHVLIEPDARNGLGEHRRERRLVDDQRIAPQIVSIQLDQVESIEEHAVVMTPVTDALE